MIELYEPAAGEQGKRLICTLPETPAHVTGDRALLGQMIANLIENALRHSGDAEAVDISLEQTAGQVTLNVADGGPGIPAADRDKVLQRLYRLDRSRGTPGHGLGLALVDGVAKLHGARLELIDNAPGLRVVITFDS
jgi:signal transduction histidine kinase